MLTVFEKKGFDMHRAVLSLFDPEEIAIHLTHIDLGFSPACQAGSVLFPIVFDIAEFQRLKKQSNKC